MRQISLHLFFASTLVLVAASARGQDLAGTAVETGTESTSPSLDAGTGAGSQPAVVPDRDLTPEVMQKLSAEQIVDLIKTRQKQELILGNGSSPAATETWGVEVIVPVAFLFCVGFIVASVLFFRFRRHRLIQETLRLMVEKGRDIPPELLVPVTPPRSDLRRGILLISVGVGVSTFLLLVAEEAEGAWGLGMIPLLIGVAYLVVYRLAGDGTRSNS
ncbi:MAG: DUF6249 domain-containing protein [Pseudomonadota bacterium]